MDKKEKHGSVLASSFWLIFAPAWQIRGTATLLFYLITLPIIISENLGNNFAIKACVKMPFLYTSYLKAALPLAAFTLAAALPLAAAFFIVSFDQLVLAIPGRILSYVAESVTPVAWTPAALANQSLVVSVKRVYILRNGWAFPNNQPVGNNRKG